MSDPALGRHGLDGSRDCLSILLGTGALRRRCKLSRHVALLDLLDPPPLSGASAETDIRSTKGTRPSSHLAFFIRVALVSRTPIHSIRASATTTCRLTDGSVIAVNQLLKDSAGTKNSTRFCKGGDANQWIFL